MSQIQKAQGIVIKKIDYKENANLITLLTKEGKIALIVRGAKKMNSVMRNYTNLFSVLDFKFIKTRKLNFWFFLYYFVYYIIFFHSKAEILAGWACLSYVDPVAAVIVYCPPVQHTYFINFV